MITINNTCLRLRALAFAVTAAALLPAAVVHAQTISTVAGNGTQGFSGDDGAATAAQLNQPIAAAIDATGNSYIVDYSNRRVRKITPAGVISTVAGNGTFGFNADGNAATAGGLVDVYRVAVDTAGNMYLPEYQSHRIRKITPAGIISTVVGTGVPGFSGDGGPATAAQINGPVGIALDTAGSIYFTDYGNSRVRKVSPTGVISTIAGTGDRGFSGDGGPATSATFLDPIGLSVAPNGVVYVADTSNSRIRRIGTDGTITTVAGNGTFGFSGDGSSATAATLFAPWDVKADAVGGFYIADTNNSRVRYVRPNGVISTFAGSAAAGFSGDGGPANTAALNLVYGLAIGPGRVQIADLGNHRIRQVSLFSTCAAEGYIGSKLTLCQKVCEVQQTSTTLTSLVKLYTAIYREAPPCAR